jgi:uncharacterized protein YjbI with pentapeptide repeats
MQRKTTFKTWLIIVSAMFFFPFIGVFINEITSAYFCDLYTLGLDRKDFFTVWIALFGAIGIAFNIHQNHLRTTNQDRQLVNQNIQLEKQAEQIQLQGTQLELQSKSQRDSRFSKGVELLGNANESARTGAAYSLFFLAKDYPKEFAKPVFEILCSHVRSITTTEEYKKRNEDRPSNEIQSIIDLVFRNTEYSQLFYGLKANLMCGYLQGVNLYKANLTEAYLKDINISKASLCETLLKDAYLENANLKSSYIEGIDLSNTILANSDLSNVYCSSNANLANANLTNAKLIKTNLSGANLSGANLISADLSNTIMSLDTDLTKAILISANLSNADLSGANLSEANLSAANLSDALLYDCILKNTLFSSKTILWGVDLSDVDMTEIKGKIDPIYKAFKREYQ